MTQTLVKVNIPTPLLDRVKVHAACDGISMTEAIHRLLDLSLFLVERERHGGTILMTNPAGGVLEIKRPK